MNAANTQPSAAAPASTAGLTGLLTIEQYQALHADLFPSIESVRWHMRRHRGSAEADGAILYIAGKLRIDPARYDALVIAAGKQAAQRRTAGSAA